MKGCLRCEGLEDFTYDQNKKAGGFGWALD